MRVVATLPGQGRKGLWRRHFAAIADTFGYSVRQRRRFDWETDAGIIATPDHACVLKTGTIIESNGIIWDYDLWLCAYNLQTADCRLYTVHKKREAQQARR